MLATQFQTLARYNAWANRALYDAAGNLSDAECQKDRGAAYFGSILKTLNHLLVVDRLWFPRLKGISPSNVRLDQILHDDLGELRAAREAEDARIVAQVDAMGEAALAADCAFRDTKGKPWTMPAWQILATVFNHETHHRGQVHALLKDAGTEPPSLDLPVYLRSSE
jgi:uncharacterized damage-inducible protein DinB